MRKLSLIKKSVVVALTLSVVVMGTGCSSNTDKETTAATTAETTQEKETTVETETTEVTISETAEETVNTEDAALTSNIYEYVIMNEGTEYMNYLHFYENGVWYYSKYNNGEYQAGYYVVEEGTAVDVISTGNDYSKGDEETVSCSNKIIFYGLDGTTVVGECGYNDISTMIGVTIHGGRDFVQNLESTHTSDDEKGVTMAEYFIEGDEYSTVALKHNGTFQDTINMMISGTWEMKDSVYTLTNEATEKSYTLTDNGDGTATYVGEDGTEAALVAPTVVAVELELSGKAEGAYGDLEGVIAGYEDGSLTLVIAYAGTETTYEGTWEMAGDYSKITFVIDGTDYEAPRAEDNTFSFDYPANDGTQDVVVTFATAAGN